MKTIFSILCAIILSCICCNNKDYIIPTNIEYSEEQRKEGITVKQAKEHHKQSFKELRLNTIGRSIPYIEVYNLENKKYNLQDFLDDKRIIVASDLVCGWGYGHLTQQFPDVIAEIDSNMLDKKVICLIVNREEDSLFMNTLKEELIELNSIYGHLFMITYKEARKINMLANPTRIYLAKNQSVKDIAFGMAVEDKNLKKEILSHLD